MAFLMQHFTLELLRKGVIDRNDKPDLYREALMEREKLADVMHAIGRELVPDIDKGLIGIRNFTEEEDDALVEGAGADTPPLPSFHRAALSFYESAALFMIFNHQVRHQSMDEEASWVSNENMVEMLLHVFAQKYQNNAAVIEKQIRTILKKLRTFGLVDMREADGETYWRGTRYLTVIMTHDMAREFARSLEELKTRMAETPDAKNGEDGAQGDFLNTDPDSEDE